MMYSLAEAGFRQMVKSHWFGRTCRELGLPQDSRMCIPLAASFSALILTAIHEMKYGSWIGGRPYSGGAFAGLLAGLVWATRYPTPDSYYNIKSDPENEDQEWLIGIRDQLQAAMAEAQQQG